MKHIRFFEEYRFYPMDKTIENPVKDPNEPFFNKKKPEYKQKKHLAVKSEQMANDEFLVVLNNNTEEIFPDFKSAIKYLYDNRHIGIRTDVEPWPYFDKPNVRYYNDIYRELGIDDVEIYISSRGKVYFDDDFVGTLYRKYWNGLKQYLP